MPIRITYFVHGTTVDNENNISSIYQKSNLVKAISNFTPTDIFNNIEYTKQLRIGLNFFSVGSVMGRILDPNRFVLQLFYIEVDRNPTHVSPRQFYYFDCEKRIVMNITDEEDLALFRDEQFFYRVAPLVIKYQGNQGEVEIRPVE